MKKTYSSESPKMLEKHNTYIQDTGKLHPQH